jgi:hypothetical protein
MTTKAPTPLSEGKAVDWWFAFKFNSATYPGEAKTKDEQKGIFGGELEDYDDSADDARKFSQRYASASSANTTLKLGEEHVGTTLTDPLGETFGQVYDGDYFYVVWNDQLYGNPINNKDAPWGHSKGMAAWNADGEGMVLQVSTPSWPASGSRKHPRQNDGNTLGYIDDDDIEVSQHFFSLKLSPADLQVILAGLVNAHVGTDKSKAELVNNGGPDAIQGLVEQLGKRPESPAVMTTKLSSGVTLISKPSEVAVPPWQLVSAQLGGVDLRVASWWMRPEIYSTTRSTKIGCWSGDLADPGGVEIATSGTWQDQTIGLTGGTGSKFNHSKIGVSADADTPLSIFGDMNQQGALCEGYDSPSQKCSSSQNGRGGLFYVLDDAAFHEQLSGLLSGESAPTEKPADS